MALDDAATQEMVGNRVAARLRDAAKETRLAVNVVESRRAMRAERTDASSASTLAALTKYEMFVSHL